MLIPLLWARLRSPEKLGLCEIHDLLRAFRDEPAEQVGQIQAIKRRSALPGPLRRLAWWRDMHISGRLRARRLGTPALASAGAEGPDLIDLPYPATALILVGPIDSVGTVDVRLKYDARLMHVRQAVGTLQDLERALTCEILMELRYFQKLDVA